MVFSLRVDFCSLLQFCSIKCLENECVLIRDLAPFTLCGVWRTETIKTISFISKRSVVFLGVDVCFQSLYFEKVNINKAMSSVCVCVRPLPAMCQKPIE